MRDDSVWVKFYQAIQGRQPRPLFLAAVAAFAADGFDPTGAQAIDLGCGDGTETAALLAQGWRVLALDQEPAAISHVLAKVPEDAQPRLQARAAPFADVVLPPAHFIYAGLSLPFCVPLQFPILWSKVVQSLHPNGRFAGHFFGERDGWRDENTMTFHTMAEVQSLFAAFALERLEEYEDDMPTALGQMKHWHVIEVIARR
jgi:tellurite methyltransferase